MYNILEELIEHTHRKDNLTIMGDLNAVVGNAADSDMVGKYELGTRNERGNSKLVLISFCKQNSFVIINTFFEVPLRRRYL